MRTYRSLSGIPHTIAYPPNAHIMLQANNFALRGIPLPSWKSWTALPNNLLLTTRLYHLSEDLTKQAAATIIRGVVGRPGTTIPINPTINANIPSTKNSGFAILPRNTFNVPPNINLGD